MGLPGDDGGDVLLRRGSREEWSRALTLAMGEEVVSKRGGGAGVTISGAHTVTAQGGAELLHACQSLCREEGCETGDGTPGARQHMCVWAGASEVRKVRNKRKGRYSIYRNQTNQR